VWHDAAHWLSEVRTTIDETPSGVNPVLPPVPGALHAAILVYSLFDLFTLAWTIVLMVFMYNAATHARNLGLPARLQPIWAVLGWIIPVVNVWFPYWVLRDCLPATATERGDLVLRYWLLYVFGFVLLAFVVIGRLVSPLLGALFLVVSVGYAILEGHTGSRALERINKSHEALTASLPAQLRYR
jgi:hypothetical protein